MPWSVERAQNVFGVEVTVKQRTPDHDFPRTPEQAASFEKYMADCEATAKKKTKDVRSDLERRLHAADEIDYFTALGARTLVRGQSLRDRLNDIVTKANTVKFKKGDVIVNDNSTRMLIIERRQDGTCLAKALSDDGRAHGHARSVSRGHNCVGCLWVLDTPAPEET